MAKRSNFTRAGRTSALQANGLENAGNVDGVWIAEAYLAQKAAGQIYYCENCKFCHTDASYFNVDHLVPDTEFKRSGSSNRSNLAINMAVLCTSKKAGDFGCNQCKGGKLDPPPGSGLAYTNPDIDMNCCPLHLRNAR
jgi:hypothetical protein